MALLEDKASQEKFRITFGGEPPPGPEEEKEKEEKFKITFGGEPAEEPAPGPFTYQEDFPLFPPIQGTQDFLVY